MTRTIEPEQEDDGCWIAEVMDIPGGVAYGQDREEAFIKAALRALADKLEHGELASETTISFLAA